VSAIIQQGVPAPDAARIRSSQRAEWAVLAPQWRTADLTAGTRSVLRTDVIATVIAMFPDGQVRLGGEANLAVAVRPA